MFHDRLARAYIYGEGDGVRRSCSAIEGSPGFARSPRRSWGQTCPRRRVSIPPTPPLRPGYGPSSPNQVIAHVHSDGRMAITLTAGTCLQVPDLDEWQLLAANRCAATCHANSRSTWWRTTAAPDDWHGFT